MTVIEELNQRINKLLKKREIAVNKGYSDEIHLLDDEIDQLEDEIFKIEVTLT